MDTSNLPRYAAHKEVHALKIVNITDCEVHHGAKVLHFEGHLPFLEVSYEWNTAKKPHVGGYLVIYADGYQSFSPAKAFEEGYTEIKGMASALTRDQIINQARHFKVQRNNLRDAVLDYLNAYNAGIRTVEQLEMFAGGLRQPGTRELWDARFLMGLVDAVRPSMDDPRMLTAAPEPTALDALVQMPAQTESAPVARQPEEVQLDAHMEERAGVRGLFIPEGEAELLGRSLASLAGYAEETGAYPRLKSAFKAILKIIGTKELVDETVTDEQLAAYATHIAANVAEYAWVIEKGDPAAPEYAYVNENVDAPFFEWTTDKLKALRFARQADASNARAIFFHASDIRVAEHCWG